MTGEIPREDITIDVRRGNPTEEELAALIAVVSEAYATEAATAVVEEEPSRSAWAVSQRGLRTPLPRVGW
ncbi:acyl-CoA carboxylase subunit epsilon [Microbacterium sp. NPDC077184]|uniref:acyl-CoA carboxylase subunit epsilon n=1 Tax=Microbacterium sp. NPDC077184 TaxID=3154764 RepID=UPI003425549C